MPGGKAKNSEGVVAMGRGIDDRGRLKGMRKRPERRGHPCSGESVFTSSGHLEMTKTTFQKLAASEKD